MFLGSRQHILKLATGKTDTWMHNVVKLHNVSHNYQKNKLVNLKLIHVHIKCFLKINDFFKKFSTFGVPDTSTVDALQSQDSF